MKIEDVKQGSLIKIEVLGKNSKIKEGVCIEKIADREKYSIEIIDINGKLARTLATKESLKIQETTFGKDIDDCLIRLLKHTLKRRELQLQLDNERSNIEETVKELLKNRNAVSRDTFFVSLNKGCSKLGLDCSLNVGSHNKQILKIAGDKFSIKVYTDKNYINCISINTYGILN